MNYIIKIKPSAVKNLEKLSYNDQKKIARKIDSLAQNPRPATAKKLKGQRDLYRLRVGDYRIIYQVKDKILLILVVSIGHRKDIYQFLRQLTVYL